MLPIYLCGKEIGSVQRTSHGIYARCSAEPDYIYRLELVGKTSLSLGVMMPKGSDFVLEKRGDFLPEEWQYGEISRSYPDERPAYPLPFALSHGMPCTDYDFTQDELLIDCISMQSAVRTAVFRKRRYIYFPFDINSSCALSPFLFCLTVFTCGERSYAAFCVDENGIPDPI